MTGGSAGSVLDPGDRFEVEFEGNDGWPYLLTVHEVRWEGNGVLLLGDTRRRLFRGGLGVVRMGCDLWAVGVDGLPAEQRALVLRCRPSGGDDQ